ncbi:MAG TPA: lamin tail domain-containing protein [Vicinamibacterales bacterium]|nr:lamin tail domain-containing protein [Vicinamibacterales bacterium]
MNRSTILRAPLVCRITFAFVAAALLAGTTPSAVSSDPVSPPVTISQIYGGGGNSGATYKNDFIELYNRTAAPVSIDGWSVQYASATGTTWQTTALSGSIPAYSYYLIQQAAGAAGTTDLPAPNATGTIAMSATAGKVALVSATAALSGACPTGAVIVDFAGFGTTANCFEGTGPTPAPSNTTAVLRKNAGDLDTNNNATDFVTGAPNPRNSPPPSTPPTGSGTASPAAVVPGSTTLLTVTVSPGQNPASSGLAVIADLSSIGGSATQPFYDNATNGDVAANDNIFSFSAAVAPGTTPGAKSIPATITDAQSRSGSTIIGFTVGAPITTVTISQIYGGGGNSGGVYRNDFVELYNHGTAPVSLSGWSLQYASATGSAWGSNLLPLSGTIQPGRYYLIQLAAGANTSLPALPAPDATGGINMSGTDGKVALVSSTSALSGACPSSATLVDFVGYGSANCAEGNAPVAALSNTLAAHRAGGGSIDTNNNAADFTRSAPAPRNSQGQPPSGTGAVTPSAVDSGDEALITVAVTPGNFPAGSDLTVVADLSDIGGPSSQALYDDGTHGDVEAGNGVYSFSTVVTGTAGTIRTISATIGDKVDGVDRTSTTTFSVAINAAPTPIHVIQGSGTTSTLVGQLVSTTGIVTAVRPSSFYIQTPDDEVDGDPNTSEGLLIFTGFPRPEGFTVGDLVKVTGTVTEFRQFTDSQPITELTTATTKLISSGHALPAPVRLLPAYTRPDGGLDQLERFEGMRVTADITAISGTSAFSRTASEEESAISVSNGDFFAVITGVARPMREEGVEQRLSLPSGAPCCVPRFDENPERIRVDSDGQVGAAKIEIVAGQAITGLTGVLDYGSRVYTIVPDQGAWTPSGNGAAIAVPVPSPTEFTVASFNMERFFDDDDDPARPPQNEPVLTPAAYQTRLSKASLTIRNVLRMPDIIGVQEIENLSALSAIAARVNADAVAAGGPNPQYVAHLFEGNDVGGIDVGFLVKTSRVAVVNVWQEGKDATYVQPNGNSALLNDRPPVVLEAEIMEPGMVNYPVTVIVNHLRSMSGINGSDGTRIRAKRHAQAEFLASLIQARQAANPGERIISVGDYNAFQFNDGYAHLVGTIKGQPAPADQVVLTGGDLVNPDLVSLGDGLGADQYSYLFDGNAQTIDHVLVNPPAHSRFSRIAYARVNTDFPESLRADGTRPERLSDHDPVVAYFRLPGTPSLTLNGPHTMTVEAGSTFVDQGAVASDDELGPLAVTVSGSVDTTVPGTNTLTYSATNGYRTTTTTRTVIVVDTTAPVMSALSVTPTTIHVPNHSMIDVGLFYTATDATGTPACSAAVASNEPANALGDGNTAVDFQVVSPTAVRVRAERSGRGTGRIYTITVTCADASGNQAFRTATVTVPK